MRFPVSFLSARDGASRSDRILHRVAAVSAMLITATMVVLSVPTTVNAATLSDAGTPSHTSSSAVVKIKVGGVRNADGVGGIDALEGVRLGLYTGNTMYQKCTSTAGGYCSFTVTGSGNLDKSYTIRQLASIPGSEAVQDYYSNLTLTTGLSSGNFQRTNYQFTTPTLRAGNTYTSGSGGFMVASNGVRTASGGIWQNSYNNPIVPSVCGLSTAILLDLSSSVAVGSYLSDLKGAAKAIVDALAGTPSSVALYSFGTQARELQTSLPASSTDNVTALKKAIDDLKIPAAQYTNWDAGLFQMVGKKYNQVLVITDGNPTAYTSAGLHSNQVDTRFIEIEQAVASANLLKSEGTRIVAVGVGDGVSGPGDNLQAISGPVKNSDYFQTSNYTEATKTLKAIALAGCSGTVTVVKNVVPHTSPAGSITGATPTAGWTFTHATDANGTARLTPASGKTDATGTVNYAVSFATGQSTSAITITETQQSGYTIIPRGGFNAVCKNNGTGDDVPIVNNPDGSPGFTVLASKLDAISCAVYNRAPSTDAQLTLVKEVVNDHGGTARPGAWTLVATPASGAEIAVTTGTVSTIPAGTAFALSERSGPAGYEQTGLTCSVDGGTGTPATSITLAAGQHATCTFTNTDIAPELKLTKVVSPSGAANAASWTLTGTGTGSATVSGNGGTGYVAITAGIPYALSEAPVSGFASAGEFSSGSWVCTPAGGAPYALTGGALPALVLGARVECVITNTLDSIVPRIVKTAGTPIANADGTWTIRYDIAVTNPSTVAAIDYDLKDTPAFGGDISFVAVNATGPDGALAGWTGVAPNNVLASGVGLAANTTAHYIVTVKATVAKGAFEAIPNTTRCQTGPNPATGGFLNRAILTSAGVDYPANDCVEPVKPVFDKSVGSAISHANGTWGVTYTLTVANPSKTTALVYDLVDEFALAPGVTVEGVVVTHPAGVIVDDDLPAKPLIVTAANLAADTTDTYQVTLTVSVPPTVAPATLACDGRAPSLGLFNSATLSSGEQVLTDDACASLELPSVVHTKTVTSTQQESDGTWAIDYDIEVTNKSATIAGRYDLVDVPALGTGITVSALGTATGPAAQAAAWNGVGSTVLASDEPIAAGASHHYTVTVHAAVAVGVIGTEAANCTIDGQETGTGFLNLATLTAAAASAVKNACSQPVSPSFTKELGDLTAVGLGGADFTVTYLLTAKNDTALDLHYDLTDTLGFASGVLVTDASVSGPDGIVAGWDGAGNPVIATGRPLLSHQTEVWTVSVDLTVTERVTADTMQCLRPGAPGHGLFNAAMLTSGSDEFPGSACAPVPPQLPTLPFDPPTLAFTGAQVIGWFLAGLALIGVGVLLVPFRRRRAPRHLA